MADLLNSLSFTSAVTAVGVWWLLFGIWCALIAHDKGTGLSANFTLGVILGPIGVLICAAGRNDRDDDRGGGRRVNGPPPRVDRRAAKQAMRDHYDRTSS